MPAKSRIRTNCCLSHGLRPRGGTTWTSPLFNFVGISERVGELEAQAIPNSEEPLSMMLGCVVLGQSSSSPTAREEPVAVCLMFDVFSHCFLRRCLVHGHRQLVAFEREQLVDFELVKVLVNTFHSANAQNLSYMMKFLLQKVQGTTWRS